MQKFFPCIAVAAALTLPLVTSGHEVYVLPPEVVAQAISSPGFSFIEVITDHLSQFIFWGFISVLVVVGVFFISILRVLERVFDPILAKLPPYAPVISRVAIGLSFLAAAYYQALFGPELPLEETFGSLTPFITVVLWVVGFLITFGIYTRVAAFVVFILFAWEALVHGSYLFTYTNYVGELAVLAILGGHQLAVHHRHHDSQNRFLWFRRLKERLQPYAFTILRVSFGISLLYASVYAKVIHNQLALEITNYYPEIVTFFGFEPHFLVLGAAIIEIILGLFFILGIEIRFTSLFILFWLSLSLWYFGEAVWPHIILIGIPIAFICYGYDRYSLEGFFFKRGGREPVL